jgi:putative flippase GtrA
MQISDAARWLQQFRYIKFGIVGASGTVVNIAVLYLAKTYLFEAVEPEKVRLGLALALAIFVATLSNFTWNRLWTWADRQDALAVDLGAPKAPFAQRLTVQFGRYCMASWFGMAFQFVVTIWLSHYMVDWLANVTSIVAASVINFLANDRWTFKVRRKS